MLYIFFSDYPIRFQISIFFTLNTKGDCLPVGALDNQGEMLRTDDDSSKPQKPRGFTLRPTPLGNWRRHPDLNRYSVTVHAVLWSTDNEPIRLNLVYIYHLDLSPAVFQPYNPAAIIAGNRLFWPDQSLNNRYRPTSDLFWVWQPPRVVWGPKIKNGGMNSRFCNFSGDGSGQPW